MTKEELDFIGSMNMCDEISNDAYKKIACHVEETIVSDDCVSREQAIVQLSIDLSEIELPRIKDSLDKLPPVTPTRKVGKWIYDSGSYKCPFCEHEITGKEDDLNYCCKCGAEMRVGE